MDDYLSLRSLEGNGRSLGTERPSSSLPRLEQNEASKARNRRSAAEERPSQRTNGERTERSRNGQELAQVEPSRDERSEFQRELDDAQDRVRENRRPSGPSQPSQDENADAIRDPRSDGNESPDAGDTARASKGSAEPKPEPADARPEPSSPDPMELTEPLAFLASPASAPPPVELSVAPIEAAPQAGSPVAPGAPLTNGLARPLEGSLQAPAEAGPSNAIGTAAVAGANADVGLGAQNSGAHTGGESAAPSELAGVTGKTTGSEAADAKSFRMEAANAQRAEARPADVELAGSILRQFRLQFQPKLDSAVMQLHPAELGRIAIKLEVKEGKLRAVMRAERAETLNVLERHLPELRATLEGAGIEAQSFDLGLGFESQDGGDASFADLNSDSAQSRTEELIASNAVEQQLARAIVSESAVDIHA